MQFVKHYKGFDLHVTDNAGREQLNARPSVELLAERPSLFPVASWNMTSMSLLLDAMLELY